MFLFGLYITTAAKRNKEIKVLTNVLLSQGEDIRKLQNQVLQFKTDLEKAQKETGLVGDS